jgi:hypothetical protein
MGIEFIPPHRFTYLEVAMLMRVSPARVRQIEQRALAKLRRGLEKRGVTADEVKELVLAGGDDFRVAEVDDE